MRTRMMNWVILLTLLVPGASYAAGECTTVSVVSAAVGQPLVATVTGGADLQVHTGAAVPVCVMRADGDCATALTTGHGICYAAATGWEYLASDRWQGQLCGRLQSGSTPVAVEVCIW